MKRLLPDDLYCARQLSLVIVPKADCRLSTRRGLPPISELLCPAGPACPVSGEKADRVTPTKEDTLAAGRQAVLTADKSLFHIGQKAGK